MKIRRIHQFTSVLTGLMGLYYLKQVSTPVGTALSTILLIFAWNFWQRSKLVRLKNEVLQ